MKLLVVRWLIKFYLNMLGLLVVWWIILILMKEYILFFWGGGVYKNLEYIFKIYYNIFINRNGYNIYLYMCV